MSKKTNSTWYIITGEHVRLARECTGGRDGWGRVRGLTQEEFAKRLGVNRRTVIRAERGGRLNLFGERVKIRAAKFIEVTGWNPETTPCPNADRCTTCRVTRDSRK